MCGKTILHPFFVIYWPVSGSLIKFSFFPFVIDKLPGFPAGLCSDWNGKLVAMFWFLFLKRNATYKDCDISDSKDDCSTFAACCPLSLLGSSPDSRPCFHGGNAFY